MYKERCFTEGPGRPESPVDSAESKPKGVALWKPTIF